MFPVYVSPGAAKVALALLTTLLMMPLPVMGQASNSNGSVPQEPSRLGTRAIGPAGLDLELRALVPRGSGGRADLVVSDGGVLRSGDQIQVRMTVARDAYVYLVAKGGFGL